jgi:hypothetical protein
MKKIIAVKSKKTKTIYFKFTIISENIANTDNEKNFEFIPIFEGTNYQEAFKK